MAGLVEDNYSEGINTLMTIVRATHNGSNNIISKAHCMPYK